ncbi:putative general amidase [Aspergillus ruber CBS 135680]|uniref:amidase n=1 Tax=Aspergillus ruber (strain CBS 135680) TaxID=1388766 RepID=A0A017SCQ2_ASPRC|nr:amidase [Aspergillus ruber CBS 135680]EYE94722.1 amidase [Aspergillus ruber CBS 135680]
MTITDWQQKVQVKQAQAASKIPAEWRLSADILQQASGSKQSIIDVPRACGLLTEQELHITEDYDATALLTELATGKITSVEVTRAFCKRAAIAQQLTSCLTETFFDVALARARQLDNYLATSGKPMGPLHGLPISIKEPFNVVDVPTSLGFVSFLDNPPPRSNSAMVEILLAAGAVLYVKTNVPQTMMTADSENNVFGRVLNPHRLSLTAGGSSGGEGALVAMRGSILGIGTDVAGSIRIPSLCCGTFGFKPSAGRVPCGGQTSPGRDGLTGIEAVAGPLCHSTRDAELLLRTVFDAHADDFDDKALGVPWTEPVSASSTLTIGVLPEDPQAPLHPPMERTLETVLQKLAAAGHHIVNLSGKVPSLSAVKDLSLRYFCLDPDNTPLKHIANGQEPKIASLASTYKPEGSDPEPTLRDLYDLNVARSEIVEQMRRVFLDNHLDAIIGPGYQTCAVPHDTYGFPVYTVFANVLDYPACIIPFGKANEVADAEYTRDVAYVPPYLPKEIENAPCHVQLIGRRLKDEKLVRHAEVVQSVLAKGSH